MRHLLMVTYFFPPLSGVGIERTLKHATYLPENGWRPVVLTASNSAYRLQDPATLERVPEGTEVHRAATAEPGHVRQLLRSVLGRPASSAGAAQAASTGSAAALAPATPASPGSVVRSALNRAWGWAVPATFFPDEHVLWAPSAVLAGARLHADHPVDAIYSSSPPVSGHLAAAALAELLELPWIADFRDPWIGNAFARPLGPLHRALQREIERRIVERAARVILATSGVRDDYARRYPFAAERFIHIPNGYDLTELRAAAAPPPSTGSAEFRLVFAGSLYGEQELELFLDGLGLLLERQPELRERLRVDFIGWFSQHNERIAARRLPTLAPVVRHLGFRPKSETIARELEADAGLILLADGPSRGAVVAAKTYEYLGLDLPILAVAPPGALRDMLAELEWGVAADPTPEGVAEGISRIVEVAPQLAGRTADPDRRYERRAQSARLAGLLDAAVAGTLPGDAGEVS
jgi:glycosyltransferase involved in cell wall biosynthesis